MFNRWRQENFFKYMAEEFALDALVEYGVDEVSAELDRPNPEWTKIDKRLKRAKADVTRLEAELGAEQLNAKATQFPGTNLRLHLATEAPSPVI